MPTTDADRPAILMPAPPAPLPADTSAAQETPMPQADDDDSPGTSDRDLLLYMLRKTDRKRDEQIEATRELAKAMNAHNEGATARHAAITEAVARAPGRWEFRALGAALVALTFWIVALYAQANGQDAGKAARDAHDALRGTAAAAAPAGDDDATPTSTTATGNEKTN